MSSHPDADAFVRAFLRNPQDETQRLVFADWLDDTGEAHNAAWAGYIRAKAAAARHEFGSPGWRNADQDADRYVKHIRATLRLPVGSLLNYPASLLRLLPGPNITVRLAGVDWPPNVVELIPESVARECDTFPLQAQQPAVLVAMIDPWDREALGRLDFILNRTVVPVRAEPDDLRAAVDATYGTGPVEVVECVLHGFPEPGPPPAPTPDDPDWPGHARTQRAVALLLDDAVRSGARRVMIRPHRDGGEVAHLVDGEWESQSVVLRDGLGAILDQFARLAGASPRWERRLRTGGGFRHSSADATYLVGVTFARIAGGHRLDLDLALVH